MKGHGNKIIAREGRYRVLRTATMYLVQRKLHTWSWGNHHGVGTRAKYDAVARFPRKHASRFVNFQDGCAKRLMYRMILHEAQGIAIANHAMRALIIKARGPRP